MERKARSKKQAAQMTPYLLYNDVGVALKFLNKAFGFSEYGDRFEGPDGWFAQPLES